MLGISVWKFLSLYEAVAWDSFFRLSAIFTWISWNWIAFFIYKCSNRCYCWCICCRSFCSVHIFTNNCNRWSCSCKFRFWFEGYCSVWGYCVCTNTWNSLSCWTIVKCCWNIIIHWNTTVAFFECWFARLFLTFWSNSCSWFTCWCYWSNLRCVSCFSWGTVGILSLNLNGNNITWISLICWCKGDNTCCFINCECTDNLTVWWLSIYWSCWLTIFIKKGNRILVDWRNWISFCECNSTSLNYTLRCYWFSWCRCWCYWCHSWCISCRGFGSVLIFTNNRYSRCSSDKWFLRNKCHRTVDCYCVSTNAVNCLSRWTIVKCRWNVVVHWHTAVTFSEYRFTCLSSTLDICWSSWSSRRSYRSYCWGVSRRGFGSVLVFTNNRYSRCSSDKWFLRNKCHRTVGCYCVSTNAVNCLGSWTIVKCRWNIFIDSYCFLNTINGYCSTLEFRFTCLSSTLDVSWFRWCCCWSYWCHSWGVSRRSFGSILIFTNNRYGRCFTCEWFLWHECNCSICCYCICTNTINCLGSWTIVESSWNVIVHWHTAVTFCEYRFTCLSRTLDICWFSWSCCRCYWCYGWCVSCRCFGSVLIFTNNRYGRCFTCEWFLWHECNCSICCYCICPDSINCLGSWTIVESSWNVIVHWHTVVAFSKFRLTCLGLTLFTCCFNWCRCRCYRSHSWCVLSCDFSSILIHTFHSYACSCSGKWFFWDEGYCSIWCYCVCSFPIYCLSGWAIFEGGWSILIDWNIWIAFSKGWFTCLSGTLDICRCCIFRCWNDWSNLRCICCFYCCSICVSCLNLNWNNITWVWFISWCEGYNTCFLINCESTNNLACWWFSIYRCSWLTIIVKKSNGILVDWYNWITFCESNCSSLNKTLRSSWFGWCCSWCYRCDCWGVSRRSFGSVLIFTNNRYGRCFTCEWFLWHECNCSICCYCICPDSINCLGSWTIVKCCWNSIVHWHTAITLSKYRLTCLSDTLNICWFSWCCSWCYWSHSWCISCRGFGSVLIFTNNRYGRCFTCEWLFRNKSYCSICSYCICTSTFHSFSRWAIIKCCWNIFVDWYTAITLSKFRFTSLSSTLDVSWFRWCCCWSYWCHSWGVSRRSFGSILIFTNNRYGRCFTCEWFLWHECNCSICCYCICTNTINCLSCWTIVKCCWNVIVHWHTAVTFSEYRFTCLSGTLNICRSCIFRCWNDWSNLRCICCFYCCSICVSCLNLNWNNITWVWFISWCEGHNTCFLINCESTNNLACWWFRFYWCCWLTSFIKKSNSILVDWCDWVTFSEGNCSSLNKTLRASWFCWCSSWSHRYYCWGVSCRCFGSVLIFTNNRYGRRFTREWFLRNKGYCSVCCYCVCTNSINCLGSWTIVKCCRYIIVHWHTAVAFSKFRLTCLGLTLFTCCFNWCRCRCYRSHSWCVLSCDFSSILIHTFHSYACSCSSKWFFWREGYCSIWCDCVCSFAIYCLSGWAIFEGSWTILIDWNIWIAFSKGWSTCLRGTLDICRCCIFRSWDNWSNLRCVNCFYCCTICISCLNLNCDNIAWIWFIRWGEGYNTCFLINCESTNNLACWWFSIYRCSWLTIIVKKSNGILVDWYNWITFCESNCSSLNKTLRSSWFGWCCSWCYRCDCWGVSRRSFGSVLIFTNNRYGRRFTREWPFRNKGYCSVCCYCVCTNTVHCLSSWTIIESSWNVIVHWHTAVTFSEYRFTCLSRTLDICWLSWSSRWSYWCHSWCVLSCDWGTVLIYTFYSHACSCSSKWFLRYEGYCSICCYCVCTNTVNCLGSWAVIECCRNVIVHWHTAITFCEYRFTCLSRTLNVSGFSWCCCRCHWNDFWCVDCINFNTIWTFSLDLSWCHSTCIWFISRCEGYCSSCWINWEVTNHSYSICRISWRSCNFITIFIQELITIWFNGYRFILTIYLDSCSCKYWSTCLCGTLNILRFSRLSCWNSCYNCWCVCRVRYDRCGLTVFICNCSSCLDRYTLSSSDKVFFRCEGYSPCSWINGVRAFSRYSYSCIISRLTSCWIHQFLACDLSCLVIT